MRIAHAAVLLALTASPALAQRGAVIVIPGRPDVPILMNGVDVSWSVIEGDFGLARPGLMTPTVIYRLAPPPTPPYWAAPGGPNEPGFFPRSDKKPGYGRLEIEPSPDRPLPPPAQSYRKSWSSQSAPGPVTDYPPYPMPPVGLSIGDGRNRHRDHHHDHDHDHDHDHH